MNIIEATKAYHEGRKIRHKCWPEASYAHKTQNAITAIGTGLDGVLSNHLFSWMKDFSDGWEIYTVKKPVLDMQSGQKFIGPYNFIYMRTDSRQWTAIKLDDGHLYSLVDTYELVDEAS